MTAERKALAYCIDKVAFWLSFGAIFNSTADFSLVRDVKGVFKIDFEVLSLERVDTTQTFEKNCGVHGSDTVTEYMVRKRFVDFQGGGFIIQDEVRPGPPFYYMLYL